MKIKNRKNICKCEFCHSREAICEIDDRKICNECKNLYVSKCDICGELHFRSNTFKFEDRCKRICYKCATNFKVCTYCHNVLTKDDMCYDCTVKNKINSYYYKPTPIFYHNDKNDKLFAGIELEINFNYKEDFKKFLLEAKQFSDFVYLKHDGSLSSKGVEIVSHPANFKYHLKNYWKSIFEYLKCTNTDGCGFHIHVNKNYFTDNHAKALDYIINNCDKIICDIGSRALTNYCNKHHKRNYGFRSESSHTSACNMTNNHTIELRFCKSTNKYDTFVRKLKMVSALIEFAKIIAEQTNGIIDEMKNIDLVKAFNDFKGDYLSVF